ncbi:AAA family ATPase [Novosphingobium ginsenosidimutans]|uniref:AAA family ATPase n=1 Tax=Novosphingobium ginsenosidimutans TaxID=1176536 RepID=A0A5B8SAD5_9SPHN|nr:AAA family ATPase [Novosphingobium ginsenosidimutans]QEA17215.1 AAA family ATPase [Novosphingobium ginsenosidimutans]
MSWIRKLFGLGPQNDQAEYDDGQATLVVSAPVAPASNSGGLPRFSGLANEIEDDRGQSRELSAGHRLGRAYPVSQPVSDLRQFAGRRELLTSVIRSIEERRMHVVLYGDRGIGKTSLLHIIALLAKDARYLVRYSSCSASSDLDSTFRAIAEDIPLLYHEKGDPTSAQVESGKTLADLFDASRLTPASLSEVLDGVSGTRLLIILDEFDRTENPDFRREVAELIKNLSDRSSKVQILIGGVAENLSELVRQIPSIRRNLLGIPVGRMSDAELIEILTNGQAISGLLIDKIAQERLIASANGSPYLANLIAHQASSRAIERGGKSVTSADLKDGLAMMAREQMLRLPEAAQQQVEKLLTQVPHDQLRAAVGHALEHFGQVTLNQFPALKPMADGEASGEIPLTFVDDGVPLTIWLRLAELQS